MVSQSVLEVSDNIIDKADFFGASLAGIASVAELLASPSHKVDVKVDWSSQAKSVIVLALAHKEEEAELDWWGVEDWVLSPFLKLIMTVKIDFFFILKPKIRWRIKVGAQLS